MDASDRQKSVPNCGSRRESRAETGDFATIGVSKTSFAPGGEGCAPSGCKLHEQSRGIYMHQSSIV